MHGYLACVFTDEHCPAIEVGGTSDHVHVLCSLSRSLSMSEVIRKANANSSSWAKSLGGMLSKFNRQGRYGAFSVHPSQSGKFRITFGISRRIIGSDPFRMSISTSSANTRRLTTRDISGLEAAGVCFAPAGLF
jgi:hypothetical protein